MDLSYATMEIVGMRYSDPNALQGGTYKGDMFYPLHTETGISIEPYFNWDIENWPATPTTVLTTLQLDVSLNSDLSSPVFTTTTKRDTTPLINGAPADTDHFITDADLDTGVPLLNDTDYYSRFASCIDVSQRSADHSVSGLRLQLECCKRRSERRVLETGC